ncbi:MAG: DNA repair protein RecO [Flavobacteriales bacterium]|nr:MAG: DNA repair protein RecO [Flavobacteriales bacterium]
MFVSTRAIVLRSVRHKDRGAVVTLYTEHHGLRSYAARVGGKSGHPPALFGPLQRLVVVASERSDRDIHQLREVRTDQPFANVGSDPLRGSVALFIQEVLLRTLRAETADAELFAFVQDALTELDGGDRTQHLPVSFLLGLCDRLGFAPAMDRTGPATWFDMEEGAFTTTEPAHPHAFGGAAVHLLGDLLGGRTDSKYAYARKDLLDQLLLYFRLHIAGFGELRSPSVLKAVLA